MGKLDCQVFWVILWVEAVLFVGISVGGVILGGLTCDFAVVLGIRVGARPRISGCQVDISAFSVTDASPERSGVGLDLTLGIDGRTLYM